MSFVDFFHHFTFLSVIVDDSAFVTANIVPHDCGHSELLEYGNLQAGMLSFGKDGE
jgi:hypothetical protein